MKNRSSASSRGRPGIEFVFVVFFAGAFCEADNLVLGVLVVLLIAQCQLAAKDVSSLCRQFFETEFHERNGQLPATAAKEAAL